MSYRCCDAHRRARVDAHPQLTGIDWLEVLDADAPLGSPRQRTLLLRLLKPVPPALAIDNLRIDGGERIRGIGIEWIGAADAPPPQASAAEAALFSALPEADHVLVVCTDGAATPSTYTLRLTAVGSDTRPPDDFDPRLSAVDFSFKVECPSDFDCAPRGDCAAEPLPQPDLNYLARDYESLRRLVIDRLSSQMPAWTDRNPADLATTLAEWIAYVGDLQHYQLDAVATEAYLGTARRRSSLRRHGLLVDYFLHEGSNARTWLQLTASGGPVALPAGIRFLTRVPGVPPRVVPDSPAEATALAAAPLVFEPLHGATLREAHNRFDFHAWGDERCCLPAGTTRATLAGAHTNLAAGDVLILEEVFGPLTGIAGDADPDHRHAVRLTEVVPGTDPLDGAEITDIAWHDDDALPFPLCVSSVTDEAHGSQPVAGVSVARGNVVLVDHGRSVEQDLGVVPAPRLAWPAAGADRCTPTAPEPLPPRFRPLLADGPLTHQGTVMRRQIAHGVAVSERVPFDSSASASAALAWRSADALPAISLESRDGTLTEHWSARRDLLDSRGGDTHFVVESEDDGSARLRFGDDSHGRRPDSGTEFTARYRIGNGPDGNVGAGAIAHAVTKEAAIVAVSNPLPASGGVAPESAAQLRRRAPQAFRTQQRAVTPSDYAEVTERIDGVQRAAAGLRWTGSWHTVFVTVDREGGRPVDAAFAADTVATLDRYRMAGHDIALREPVHVSLEIDLLVCVDDGHFRSDVRRALLDALSNGVRPDGTLGLFHPDNFSFGQTVHLSPLYAAARRVPGVVSVQVTRFVRQGDDDPKPLADGSLGLGALEIARLDNDPNFPEHGVLRLDLHGGK